LNPFNPPGFSERGIWDSSEMGFFLYLSLSLSLSVPLFPDETGVSPKFTPYPWGVAGGLRGFRRTGRGEEV